MERILSPELLAIIVGAISTIVSSTVTWLLARRKYNAEVNSNVIENMQKSLDFYKQLSDDNSLRLQEVLERNNKLEDQIRDLQRQVFALMNTVCTNLSCSLRERDETILNLREGKIISHSKKERENEDID